MNAALVAFGANLGDGARTFRAVHDRLARLEGVASVRTSGLYATAPAGGPAGQSTYINGAFEISGNLSPLALFDHLEELQGSLGRKANVPWGPREIDLDLVWHGGPPVVDPRVVIPHVRMHQRWFVLRPLLDLRPGAQHPILKKSLTELFDAVEHPTGFMVMANPPLVDQVLTLLRSRFARLPCDRWSPGNPIQFLSLGRYFIAASADLGRKVNNDWIIVCDEPRRSAEIDNERALTLPVADCRESTDELRLSRVVAFLDSLLPGSPLQSFAGDS